MVVGVTGNTGTGKTVVSKLFEKWGAYLISCDELGWEVLKESHIIKEIQGKFEGVVKNGKVEREKLGHIVFDSKSKLKKFNEIVHPELLKNLRKAIESSNKRIVVVDAALIFEWRIESWFDYIVLLISTFEEKKKRLKAKGLSEKIVQGRLNSQAESSRFIKYSDFIIENDGNLQSLKNNARWVWDKITKERKKT